MATIDDLKHKSISEMSTDEALDLIRQIRLSRRVPVKKRSTSSKKKKKKAPEVSAADAAELLKILPRIKGD